MLFLGHGCQGHTDKCQGPLLDNFPLCIEHDQDLIMENRNMITGMRQDYEGHRSAERLHFSPDAFRSPRCRNRPRNENEARGGMQIARTTWCSLLLQGPCENETVGENRQRRSMRRCQAARSSHIESSSTITTNSDIKDRHLRRAAGAKAIRACHLPRRRLEVVDCQPHDKSS